MLTATYTLVALSVEQTNMRVSLHAVQQLVQKSYARQSALTEGQADYVCDTLRRLYESCQGRKLDKFLLPALRRAGAGAGAAAVRARHAQPQRGRCAGGGLPPGCSEGIDNEDGVDAFCLAVERFCVALVAALRTRGARAVPDRARRHCRRGLVCRRQPDAGARRLPRRAPRPRAAAGQPRRPCRAYVIGKVRRSRSPTEAFGMPCRVRQKKPASFFAMMGVLEVRFHHVRIPFQASGRQASRRQADAPAASAEAAGPCEGRRQSKEGGRGERPGRAPRRPDASSRPSS
jgi:hypothetical protein